MGLTSLEASLASALPKGSPFILHHVSTPPTKCPAIYASQLGKEEDETYCESHFLSVSIEHDSKHIHVFAIEVLIYTTTRLTTLFVSKADSTGYLHLQRAERGARSPLKTIATTFLQHLIDHRARAGRRLVLSLFARAQNQYLFPGSVENTEKHVLDDRGLVKWWCRVIDPILEEHKTSYGSRRNEQGGTDEAQAFIRVPGYDTYGTRTFFPKDVCKQAAIDKRWKVGDPLTELSEARNVPERCLIPRFPDDPKARFVDTLDEELPDDDNASSQSLSQESLKRVHDGRWRSIRSLEQFWEAMSFRQECSSGRLVGFIWALFPSVSTPGSEADGTTVEPAQDETKNGENFSSPKKEDAPRTTPKPQDHMQEAQTLKESTELPEATAHYLWPKKSRGEVVLSAAEYDEVGKFLLSLDYTNTATASDSTNKWIKDVGRRGSIERWGKTILGEKQADAAPSLVSKEEKGTHMLSAGLVRKKKRQVEEADANPSSNVNHLGAGLIRKKPKMNGVHLAAES